MERIIELVEKINNGDGTISLIAEINVYEGSEIIRQDSRSPFSFADTLSDEEIIQFLKDNQYNKYFS